MDMAERDFPTSVLTGRQREFLRGELDITPSAERSARQAIRERLHASVFDYSLINRSQKLKLEDIDKAFAETVEPEAGAVLEVMGTIPDIIALLYTAHRDRETLDSEGTHDGWQMEHFVETGIERALNRLGVSYETVDAEITVKRGESLEALADGELTSLSTGELKQLLIADEIDSEEFADAVSAKAE